MAKQLVWTHLEFALKKRKDRINDTIRIHNDANQISKDYV